MINLGTFKAGDIVFYAANFHNDQGTVEDPTGPEAQVRTPAGAWIDLSVPTKQNGKTGFYGGGLDTAGADIGEYIIRMAGTVATAKTVATVFSFTVRANTEKEVYDRIGDAGAGLTALGDARLANLDASVAGRPTLAAIEASTVLAKAATQGVIINYVDEIETLLKNATYGLAVLRTQLDLKPTAAQVDSQLSGTHGAGDWQGAGAAPTVDQINAKLVAEHGDGSWAGPGTGGGATKKTIQVTVSGQPKDGVDVWVTTDALGANVIAGTFVSGAGSWNPGEVEVWLDPGTYYVWAQLNGVNLIEGEQLVVV